MNSVTTFLRVQLPPLNEEEVCFTVKRKSYTASSRRKTVLKWVQVPRYLNSPGNTAFPLEYAFDLLGNICDKAVLDLGCGTGEEIPARASVALKSWVLISLLT